MKDKLNTSLAVLVPEFTLAPAAALGAVYCSSTLTPNLLKHIEETVSKHIVLPHLGFFESLGGSLKKAHEDYDQKTREQMIARGEPVPQASTPVTPPQERADLIAEILTKGAIAVGADLLATRLGHHFMSQSMDVHVPKRTAYYETAIHLGGIATMAMARPFTARGEDMHYWIKHKLQQHGVHEKRADEIGTALPYIVLPGQVAALGSLAYTLIRNGNGRH